MISRPLLSAAAVFTLVCTPTIVAQELRAHPVASRAVTSDPALSACYRMEHVIDLVTTDASYRKVLVEVAAAAKDASKAVDKSPVWRPLAGAIGAVDSGLRLDDPAAAQVGMQVVRYSCRSAR